MFLDKEGVKECLTITPNEKAQFSETEKKIFEEKHKKARWIIVQGVTDQHVEIIKEAVSAKDMMKSLTNVFTRKSPISKLFIMKKLLKFKFESGNLQDQFVKVEALLRELEAADSTLDDTDKACYLLLTMLEQYENVTTAIETMSTDITLEFVKGRLLDTELRMKEGVRKEENNANEKYSFAVQHSSGCFECGDLNYYVRNCPKRKTNSYRAPSGTSRGRGGFRGRFTRRRRRGFQGTENANMTTETQKEEEITFIATEGNIVKDLVSSNQIKFIIDSGTTEHLVMEDLEALMHDVENLDQSVNIKIANGENLIRALKERFKARDMGEVKHFLGTEITRTNDKIYISQKDFIKKLLIKFNMQQCKAVSTPIEANVQVKKNLGLIDIPYRELIGSLLYLSTISRPDITYATSFLSRYLDYPTEQLWKAAKRILRYLKGTLN